jgi:tetratricopeptide (TPR) repeat protein/predicted small lipoprotein YifL
MRQGFRWRVAGLLLLFGLTACVSGSGILPVLLPPEKRNTPYELEQVPFFPQEKYQCGPAAMAALLKTSGIDVTAEELTKKLFLPGREGTLQVELMAVARRYGRLPYLIEPDLEALLEELLAGRPVLVLQNLAFAHWPLWHYAVVIGFDPDADALLLRSGRTYRQKVSTRKFLAAWNKGASWGLILLRPGELPARPDHNRFLATLAQIPEQGFSPLRRSGYQTALRRWPDSAAAVLGLGNAWCADGSAEKAAAVFRDFLSSHPKQLVVRNNLAEVLSQLGQYQEAMAEVEKILQSADKKDPFYPVFLRTRSDIRRRMKLARP